jgi:hypothetical protein
MNRVESSHHTLVHSKYFGSPFGSKQMLTCTEICSRKSLKETHRSSPQGKHEEDEANVVLTYNFLLVQQSV